MASWADRRGFTAVRLPEHHGVEDGYCPSPITLASAMAARTQRLRLSLAAIVLLREAADDSRQRVRAVVGGHDHRDQHCLFVCSVFASIALT